MSRPTSGRRVLLALLVAGAPCAALAQGPAETGAGGGPRSTVTAPNTTATGRTKPPGAAVGPDTPAADNLRTRVERKDDAIDTGICIGCSK